MATTTKLLEAHCSFIEQQPLFFVATAGHKGRVNLSPKGVDSLRIIDEKTIMWLNLSGSGNETAAHLRELNRMTLMFCAFEGSALILRVYGQAKVLHPRDSGWKTSLAAFPALAGSRQIFIMTIDLVQTSCGTGVPVMQFVENRAEKELIPYYEEMGPEGVEKYWKRKNTRSIDGQPTGIFNDSGV
ncbi:pyridoxamine 5'-phosphate oxidase family protein [Kiloniella laminariae]|uniref:Pyridoxamine 5'-phosphate oxidase family protein n=1 Tax=Kiloniella laminariae TaxID=454162 RepID=A0ABT4LL71_9PROT|nr:pyridoxamine 5'-phosphate oxidase family protein [Kiloniella laminariae]MCZ4281101.1 pyridoxamine 5'-phosphate oxidase family protein [Kiloniella laminariae]